VADLKDAIAKEERGHRSLQLVYRYSVVDVQQPMELEDTAAIVD
jgi:hypothetical protein